MAKGLAGLAVAALLLMAGAAPAFACSKDDTAYFDSFLDTTCLQTLNNTELDPFGGIRLTTNGTPSPSTWNTDTDFTGGISYQGATFPPVGVSTLDVQGTGSPAALQLHATGMPLTRDANNPVLAPAASSSPDNDNVDDPTVVKAGATYVMYYSGTADDGSGPVILRATSTDGKSWTKTGTVVQPTPGGEDARGVFAPEVLYDSSSSTPYTMFYSGKDDEFGRIFRATSVDGINWTKYDHNSDGKPDPVVDHGRAGSADSFSAQDPSVIKDGTTYKMWYTGDDSNRKRVAYATSADGITWNKGGKVIAPEDGLPANLAEGAFAPTVWKTGTTYNMVLTGRKFVSGTTYQTKLINASSTDGISWTIGSIALNPSGTNTNFDYSNLNSPFVLQDPTAASTEQFKLYYSGNTIDPVTGGFHTRIGLATSGNASSWNKFNGSGTGNSVVDTSALTSSEAFDGRDASGPSVVEPAGASSKFVGFYWGDRGFDFKPRLGEATSTDGSSWSKVAGSAAGNSLLTLGSGAAFDAGGQRDPSALYNQNTGLSQPDYHLYFTGLSSSDTQSIGYANSQEDAVSLLPTTWANKSQLAIASGTAFDASGQSHPSVVFDGTSYHLYYTGTDSSGNTSIGCATSNNAAFATGGANTVTKNACTVLSPTAASFDKDGVKDPVVVEVAPSDWRMTYTGVEKVSDPGGDVHVIERVGYATSSNGTTWTKRGVLLDPSQTPYSFDETGVDPAGFLVDGTTIHYFYDGIDRAGRTRGGHATGDTGTTSGSVENGWATYQLGDPTTTVRDWRQIIGTSSGGVTIWVSFLQPYSSSGQEFWSSFFPVNAANATATLDFLLTVRGVRWQVREADPSTNPSLDKVELDSAPVQFTSSGSAVTTTVGPPASDKLLQWRTLTATASTYAPSGGSATGTVKVLDAAGANTLVSQPLSTTGDTTIDLSGISAAGNPALRVEFDLNGGQASPLVQALKVLYYTDASPPKPVVTLSASPATITSGGTATLSGTVTVAGSPAASQPVTINQQPNGAAGFSALSTVTTDANGNFSLAVSPAATTAYQASSNGQNSGVVTVTVLPPPIVSLTASPAQIVYGQTAVLGGTVTQSGAPVAAQPVSLLQEPAGASAFSPFASPSTDATGAFSSPVTPQSNTAYQATFPGAAPASASVGVHQLVTLKATRSGTKGSFSGKLAPAQASRPIVIQLKKGKSFVTFATAKTTSKSTFSVKKKLKACAKYQFRAVTAATTTNLDGTSLIALVEKHRVSLTVKVKGKTLLLSGKVSPLHKTGTVLIKRIVGTKAVKFAKAKITKKSTFAITKKVKKGRYSLRADMGSDRCHFAGSSPVRKARVR